MFKPRDIVKIGDIDPLVTCISAGAGEVELELEGEILDAGKTSIGDKGGCVIARSEITKERYSKYTEILDRADTEGLMQGRDRLSAMMDIESADRRFNLRLDDWLNADRFNFIHDFYGIRDNIDRGSGFSATDFGLFVPRFADEH